MKKLIYTTLAAFFGVALMASSANAQAVFNNPGEMPTVTVSAVACTQGPINGCWQPSTTVNADGTVGVHIFYHNTSNTAAQGTTISISPQVQGPTTSASFSGSVKALNAATVSGVATVTVTSSQTLTFIDAKWYPGAYSSGSAVGAAELFGAGFNVGTVAPNDYGKLVARFKVSNTIVNTTYACNDHIDNDADGLIDYPADPGCSSPTDNDEYNTILPSQCFVDNFTASPINVVSGGYTTLNWNTTGCESLTIDGVTYPVDGSGTFGPLYSGHNYQLYASSGPYSQTRQTYVGVIQTTTYQCNDGIDNDADGLIDYPADPGCSSPTDNDEYNQNNGGQCYIDSFYASPTNVSSGNYTTLSWNTTGCDYVLIDGITYPIDGSGSFGPLYSSKSYQIRASKNNGNFVTQTAYVTVNQTTQTYQCNDGYDNDGDGRIDYPNDPGCTSYNDDSEYNQIVTNTQPQAITTVASAISQTSARLNGIAIPNSGYNTTSWFEWGTSGSLGSRTNVQSTNNNSSTYYSDAITGLVPGGVYYYRAVVQNSYGTAYGDTVRFQTTKNTVVINNQPTVIIKTVKSTSNASLLELRVDSTSDRMCTGGNMDYTVTYRNISGQTLQNAVLRITHPKELTFVNSSRGDYEVVDRTVTIALGDIPAGGQGVVQVRARVNSEAVVGNLAVTTATVVYTNTISRAQEDAIAYSMATISNDCPNNLGASVFGAGSFLPHTLVGWLLLILVILALIVIGRQIYKKKE